MKKRVLILLFILTMLISSLAYTIDDNSRDENLTSEDFILIGDIEVDAVTSATTNEYELANSVVEYTEMEIYKRTINALLVMITLILAMIVPLLLRKLMGKHIGSE